MEKTPDLKGCFEIVFRLWSISAPYHSSKYIFGGPEHEAKAKAQELFDGWTYAPQVKEITGFKHGKRR